METGSLSEGGSLRSGVDCLHQGHCDPRWLITVTQDPHISLVMMAQTVCPSTVMEFGIH